MNTVLCDGGLANRLNALLFALILRRKFGHAWQMSWPINNWCGASFERLFDAPMPVLDTPLSRFRERGTPCMPVLMPILMLMQENQLNFPPERFVLNTGLGSYDDYLPYLGRAEGIVYFNNLIPSWVAADDVHQALRSLTVNTAVAAQAWAFCTEHHVNATTLGIHIRKTDFGDKVNDAALFEQLKTSGRRAFVCSDAPSSTPSFFPCSTSSALGKWPVT